RQSPRNHLIAGVFALCGLVERAGQGMNLMYELCTVEAKPLLDFEGSDSYFISLTLNGIIRDEKLILLFKRIGTDITENFVTEDYLIVYNLFFEQKLSKKLRSRIKHLVEIGIVEHLGRGKYVLSKSLYESIGEAIMYNSLVGINRSEMKNLIENYIRNEGANGASLSELMNFIPNYTRSQMQKLLIILRNENRIKTEGKANKARWYLI
ncbi:MAG: transcriptional regulator, partial [Oscillospiraceae bacterium]|nr:transcriptional regulator [Oscillospiraceae bacterium]